jgi:RNA polymerase sigma factor (sigma-70 family)
VACNTAVDVFRRGQTARKKQPQIRDLYSPAETDVHQQAMTSMAVQRLIELITVMPPAQSQVAFLRWRCEFSNHEIAQVLGISDSAVSQHLRKARELLVKELGPYRPSDPNTGEGR